MRNLSWNKIYAPCPTEDIPISYLIFFFQIQMRQADDISIIENVGFLVAAGYNSRIAIEREMVCLAKILVTDCLLS